MRLVSLAAAALVLCGSAGDARAQVGGDAIVEVTDVSPWSLALSGGPIVPRTASERTAGGGLVLAARVEWASEWLFGLALDARGGLIRRDGADNPVANVALLARLYRGSRAARVWVGAGVGGILETNTGAAPTVEVRAAFDLLFLGQGGLTLGGGWTRSFLGSESWDQLVFDVGVIIDL